MNLIYLLLKKSKLLFLLATLASILTGIGNILLIALINNLIDRNIVSASQIGYFCLVIFLLAIASLSAQTLLTYLTQNTVYDLRLSLINKVINSPLEQLERVGSSKLLAVLGADIQAISSGCSFLPDILTDLIIVISCIIYLFYLNLAVFGAILSLLFCGIIGYQLLETKAKQILIVARNEEDNLYQHFQELIGGIKELKLHNRQKTSFIKQDICATAKSCRQKNISGQIIFAVGETWGRTIFFIAIGVILFILPSWIELNFQQLADYIIVIIFMARPIESIINLIPAIGKANIALMKINSLELASEDKFFQYNQRRELLTRINNLEINNLSYRYHNRESDDDFSLKALDLNLTPGKIIFFIGGNGSGKSTLAKLITGLYRPTQGTIKLNGIEISNANLNWYCQHFSAIFADFYLFNRLLDYEKQSRRLEQTISEYLVKLNLEHKVHFTNGRFSTIALSEGQRKRLALLVTYLEDRPIYLFDEWAAEQDPRFREIFYTQILSELRNQGKIILAITHDDKYFYLADQIIKLDRGRVQVE